MIKINLALRKQPVGHADSAKGGVSLEKGPGPGSKRSLDFSQFDAEVAVEIIRELPLRKILISLAACVVIYLGVSWQEQQEINKVDQDIAGVVAQQNKLKAEIAKTKGYEELKKQLEADELLIRTKIQTIEKLLADRQTPPKLLLALANAIPKNVWLTSYGIKDGSVGISGSSLDYNEISDFMSGLNQVPFFKDLTLDSTLQVKDEKGFTAQNFQLKAKRK